MRLVIGLARENVTTRTGGPFGAGVFERSSGRLVAGGVNLVLPMRNSVLHAEVVAIMLAEARNQSFSLGRPGPEHELVTSCEPCAMCLGAIHWSGVTRLVTGATREDVESIGFSEGPVFPQSYRYLEERGLAVGREVLREEARAVLRLYAEMNGAIY
jgi:tRNA(Arg) A34 adenosine deaminase TadA